MISWRRHSRRKPARWRAALPRACRARHKWRRSVIRGEILVVHQRHAPHPKRTPPVCPADLKFLRLAGEVRAEGVDLLALLVELPAQHCLRLLGGRRSLFSLELLLLEGLVELGIVFLRAVSCPSTQEHTC